MGVPAHRAIETDEPRRRAEGGGSQPEPPRRRGECPCRRSEVDSGGGRRRDHGSLLRLLWHALMMTRGCHSPAPSVGLPVVGQPGLADSTLARQHTIGMPIPGYVSAVDSSNWISTMRCTPSRVRRTAERNTSTVTSSVSAAAESSEYEASSRGGTSRTSVSMQRVEAQVLTVPMDQPSGLEVDDDLAALTLVGHAEGQIDARPQHDRPGEWILRRSLGDRPPPRIERGKHSRNLVTCSTARPRRSAASPGGSVSSHFRDHSSSARRTIASSTRVIGTTSPRQWIDSWIALWTTCPLALAATTRSRRVPPTSLRT